MDVEGRLWRWDDGGRGSMKVEITGTLGGEDSWGVLVEEGKVMY